MVSVDEVLAAKKTMVEWDACFAELSRAEFHALCAGVIDSGRQVSLVLWLCLARKLHEDAYFSDGLAESERLKWRDLAERMVDHIVQGNPAQAANIRHAWQVEKEYAQRYGYTSPVYESMAPHQVFRAAA